MHPRFDIRMTYLAAAVLLAVALAAGCTDEGEKPAAPGSTAGERAELPENHMFDYVFTETSAGTTQWVLHSDEMKKYTGREDVELITVKMDFFRDGVHFSVLTADSGTGNMDVRNVHVWGDVVILKDNGDRLETEELFFDNESQLIHNEIFNRMTSADDVVTGIGLEATPDLEYIKIKQQMRGDVSDDSAAESGNERGSDPGARQAPAGEPR